ncbi:hypothetical protein D3C87_1924920 [compost metagenome]
MPNDSSMLSMMICCSPLASARPSADRHDNSMYARIVYLRPILSLKYAAEK